MSGPVSAASTGETGSTTAASSSTTSEPLLPPSIVTAELSPIPLDHPGTIDVKVLTEQATGVRMRLDEADPVELVGGPDEFTGELSFYTGLSSGPHKAVFTAWRDDLESEPVEVNFDVALPPPGEAYVWESADLIGQGVVAAIAALPPVDGGAVMIEFGTHYPGGQARCYLRRRDAAGAWSPADFIELHPGVDCVAIDLERAPDGALYLLASRKTGNDPRWWLGRAKTWEAAAAPENISAGGPGDTAHALAVAGEHVAVCGTRPVVNPVDKLDAAVWVIGQPARLFDYAAPELKPHSLDETLRDCVFDETTLIGVGDVFGLHSNNPQDPLRRRHLQLRFDLGSDNVTSNVGAEVGAATQSVANAVAIDDTGRVVTVGYLCGYTCKPDAELWVHAPDGTLAWYASLGSDLAAPFSIAASPAGYLVLGGARKKGPFWTSFWMGAYFVGNYEPAWIFEHDDSQEFQFAASVAVGSSGHVYGGGAGASGYPAVAYVTP